MSLKKSATIIDPEQKGLMFLNIAYRKNYQKLLLEKIKNVEIQNPQSENQTNDILSNNTNILENDFEGVLFD